MSTARVRPQQQQQQQRQQQNQASLDGKQVEFLQEQGFSSGLIHALSKTKESTPLRVWVLDNSKGMKVRDAHIIKGNYQNLSCSRWEELVDCVNYHSKLAAFFFMPTRFALLNDPGFNAGSQYFSIAQHGVRGVAQELEAVSAVIGRAQPNGPSNLTKQLVTLRQYVVSIAKQLRARNQTISIILATQGLPSDDDGNRGPEQLKDFVRVLKSLESLPVWVVMRLCTDDERAFTFFNSLDSKINLPYDVLDDFFGEALEVYLHNPWLNYSLPLHRFREIGFQNNATDIMDERALTAREVRDLCALLFRTTRLPDPTIDWAAFLSAIKVVQSKEKLQWNPLTKENQPWINIDDLNKTYAGKPAKPAGPPAQRSGKRGPSVPCRLPRGAAKYRPPKNVRPIQDMGALKKAIMTKWALEGPSFQRLNSIQKLLASVDTTFQFVEYHAYFGEWAPFNDNALNAGGQVVLKRAIRKMKIFLSPEKIPGDFNPQQKFLCKTLREVVLEADARASP